jgi:hypothetical protein
MREKVVDIDQREINDIFDGRIERRFRLLLASATMSCRPRAYLKQRRPTAAFTVELT